MIQRIQTVYLALAIILNVGFLFMPLFAEARLDTGGWLMPALAAALFFSVVLSGYGIFLYENRPRQIQICGYAAMMQGIAFGAGAAIFFTMGRIGSNLLWEFVSLVMLVLVILLQFLAIRGIKKDIELIKSMDRIR
ncbi:MAG: DUF4293 domain-containing protein [Balneolales bacterium]|nr:DUF4293 domain-containing protein [Balneolales bacterium]